MYTSRTQSTTSPPHFHPAIQLIDCLYSLYAPPEEHTMRRSLLSATRAISRSHTPSTHSRTLTTSTPQLSTETTTPTSTAQTSDAPPSPSQSRSSVAAGTVLKGLNYFKNKQDPVALEDHEYPAWLWHVLDEKPKSAAEGQKQEMDPRLFAKSARARQKVRLA